MKKPKFLVGQVVCILALEKPAFEKLVRFDAQYQTWLLDSGDFIESDLRPLTARERGDCKGVI